MIDSNKFKLSGSEKSITTVHLLIDLNEAQ